MPSELLGRAAELAEMSSFLDRSATELATLVLAGPAGTGKTALWREGLRSAAKRGWTVLSARPNGAEVSLSFSGLADLLGSADLDALASLPPVQRRALDVAFLKSDAGRGIDARTVATATLSVLRELASEAPVLVAVDDAQWLDLATARALGFALRRIEEYSVGLLVTLRDEDATSPSIVGSVPVDRLATARIGPLDQATTRAVLRRRYPAQLTPRTLNKIAEASEGNPFFAIEIAREVLKGAHRWYRPPPRATAGPYPGEVRPATGPNPGGLARSGLLEQPTSRPGRLSSFGAGRDRRLGGPRT